MAVIGRLETLEELFSGGLEELYDFFTACLRGEYKKSSFMQGKTIKLQRGVVVMLQGYKLKPFKKSVFESHKKYVDFQLTVKGEESFMLGDSKNFTVQAKYDKSKDQIIYKPSKKAHRILSVAGNLCIFKPCDVHAGGLRHSQLGRGRVYKVVAKVPVDLA